jgi:hypothetical protein
MKRILDFIRKIGFVFTVFFPTILFILLAILTFIFLPQARDVLIINAENLQGPSMFYITLTFWAYFSWYSSRLIAYHYTGNNRSSLQVNGYMRWVPRLLGALCFAAPAIAILDLSYINISSSSVYATGIGYLLLLILLAVFLNKNERVGRIKGSFWLVLLGVSLLIPVLVGYYFTTDLVEDLKTNLLFSAMWLLFSSLLFLFFTASRNNMHATQTDKWELSFWLVKIRLPQYEKYWFIAFNGIAALIVSFYLFGTLSIEVAQFILPASAPIIGFILLLGLGNMLTFLGQQLRWNLHITAWVLAFLISSYIEPHWVRMEKGEKVQFSDRPSLEEYYAAKIHSLPPNNKTIVFVLADGGASRSGYWSSSVLGALADKYGADFNDRVFAMSGASGGAVGISSFYALLSDSAESHAGTHRTELQAFFKRDFLSPTLLHMVGADIFRYLIPFPIFKDDRAGKLEKSMEYEEASNACARQFGEYLSNYQSSFTRRLEKGNPLPLLMLNTTDLSRGWPGIVSFVTLESLGSPRIDVLETVNASEEAYGYNDIRLSSAAVLCSRFPYISPAGRIKHSYFIDGGYFDNSGAGIIHEMMLHLDALAKRDTSLNLNYVVLHLRNSADRPAAEKRINPIVNDLLAPPLAAGKIIFKQTDINNERLQQYLRTKYNVARLDDHWVTFNLLEEHSRPANDVEMASQQEEDYPMSWVISRTQRLNMNKKVDEQMYFYAAQLDNWFNSGKRGEEGEGESEGEGEGEK